MHAMESQPPVIVPPSQGATFWMTGERLTLLVSGQQTSDHYACFAVWVTPGGGPMPQLHQQATAAFYVVVGCLRFRCGERTCLATAGTLIHVPRGTVYSYQNDSEMAAQMIAFYTPAGFENFVAEVGTRTTSLDLQPASVTETLFERFQAVAPKYGLEFV